MALAKRIDRLEPVKADRRRVRRVQQLENLVVHQSVAERYLTIECFEHLVLVEAATLIDIQVETR